MAVRKVFLEVAVVTPRQGRREDQDLLVSSQWQGALVKLPMVEKTLASPLERADQFPRVSGSAKAQACWDTFAFHI